jgi:hypothetical protein
MLYIVFTIEGKTLLLKTLSCYAVIEKKQHFL